MRSSPGCWTATWAAPDTAPSKAIAGPRDARVNLWRAADGRGGRDYTAEGSFEDQSHHRSLQWWATTHRAVLAAAVGALAVGGAAASKVVRS